MNSKEVFHHRAGVASKNNFFLLGEEEAMALMAAANATVLLLRKAMQSRSAPQSHSVSQPYATPMDIGGVSGGVPASRREPAVSPRDSVEREYIVCLEDGARVKSLKSYLRRFGLSPDQYRMRWGLSSDYPMVAPALSEKRAAVARKNRPHLSRKRIAGLGLSS